MVALGAGHYRAFVELSRNERGSEAIEGEPLVAEYIWYYSRGMKRKTSVTLAPHVVKAVDGLAGKGGNRSAVIERAVRELIAREAKRERDARELKIIDANADRLNREAEDVLSFQVEP